MTTASPRRQVLITGATSGLGLALSRDLAASGWEVLVHGRDEARTRELAEETGGRPFVADLASLAAVRDLARQVTDGVDRLDVLVNNAGVGFGAPDATREVSVDGHELRLAVNYLTPVLLTRLLLPLLTRSAPARVVDVGSIGQEPLDLDDIEFERGWTGIDAYRRSKLALAAHAVDLGSSLDPEQITVNCLHPASLMPTTMVLESEVAPMSSVDEGLALTRRWVADEDVAGVTARFVTASGSARPEVYDPEFQAALREATDALLA